MSNTTLLSSVTLLLIGVAGCAGRSPTPVAVRGSLLDAKGNGIENVILRFVPANLSDLRIDVLTKKDGTFELKCRPDFYSVILLSVPSGDIQFVGLKGLPRVRAPKQDLDNKRNEQKLQESNEDGDTKKQKDERFPDRYSDIAGTPWNAITISSRGRNELKLVVSN